MVATREKDMGRFSVEFELANNDDMAEVRRGHLAPEKVRRAKVIGLVDSGATGLVLPPAVAKKLGLPVTGKVKVVYANRQSGRRDKVEGAYLELLGRHCVLDAHLEPKRDIALIGAIVLEQLDLLIDAKKQRLLPRDPEIMTVEAE